MRDYKMNVDYIKLGALCELLRSWLPNYELRFMMPFEQEYVKIKLIGDKVYDFTIMLDYLYSHNENEIAEYIYDKMVIKVK